MQGKEHDVGSDTRRHHHAHMLLREFREAACHQDSSDKHPPVGNRPRDTVCSNHLMRPLERSSHKRLRHRRGQQPRRAGRIVLGRCRSRVHRKPGGGNIEWWEPTITVRQLAVGEGPELAERAHHGTAVEPELLLDAERKLHAIETIEPQVLERRRDRVLVCGEITFEK